MGNEAGPSRSLVPSEMSLQVRQAQWMRHLRCCNQTILGFGGAIRGCAHSLMGESENQSEKRTHIPIPLRMWATSLDDYHSEGRNVIIFKYDSRYSRFRVHLGEQWAYDRRPDRIPMDEPILPAENGRSYVLTYMKRHRKVKLCGGLRIGNWGEQST